MRTPRSRLSKRFSLKESLAGCAQAVEFAPESWRGNWHAWTPANPDNLDVIIDAAIESYQTAHTPKATRSNKQVFATAAQPAVVPSTTTNTPKSSPANACTTGMPSATTDKAEASSATTDGTDASPTATGTTKASRNEQIYEKVVLDLGSGKGEYTIACAKLHPETLYVGIDIEEICMIRSAERALAANVSNAVFITANDPDLQTLFAPGELDGILMNFPTPYPNKKRAPLRLTYLDRLLTYRTILAPGATIRLRTDSLPLRDFSLTQLELAGYEIKWNSDDVRTIFPDEPTSGYEEKLTAQGAVVCGFEAVPGPEPEHIEQTAPLSLVSYLPENIEDMNYIPYGMQGCVENMRGRRANCRKKGKPVWTRPIV